MKKITQYIVLVTALIFAYPAFWFVKEVKYLLYGDDSYEWQLIQAARTNDIPEAEMLLKKGANINAYKAFKTATTPLAKAINYGRIEMVDFLLKHGAKTSITFRNSNYYKAKRWLLNTFRIPISEGGQPHTWYFLDEALSFAIGGHKVVGGDIPPWIQVQESQHEIVRSLLNAGAQSSQYPLLAAAIFTGNIDLVKKMLSEGTALNNTPEQINTIVYAIVGSNNKQMVDYLLAELPQLKDPEKRNLLLHSAAQSIYPEMLEYLLAKPGMNVNAKNENGMTPLDVVESAILPNEIREKMREILLKHGAQHSETYAENSTR